MVTENQLEKLPDSDLDCLRCAERMKSAGRMGLHEKGPAISRLLEGVEHLVEFEVHICPKCGKTELFF